MNALSTWADRNGFKLSSRKTVCVHFCKKRKNPIDLVLMITNTEIPVATETKVLGIVCDHKLNFISYMKYIKLKCKKSFKSVESG